MQDHYCIIISKTLKRTLIEQVLMLLSFLRQDSVLMTMTCMRLMALSHLEMTLLIVILALDLMVAWLSMLRFLFSKITFYCKNSKGIEVIVFRVTALKQFMVIGLYRSPKVPMTQLCAVLRELLNQHSLTCNIVLGDFNVNWLN